MQMRRCTQRSPMRRQSSQPRALGQHAPDLPPGDRSARPAAARARRRVRCRPRYGCPPTPRPSQRGRAAPTRKSGAACANASAVPGQHQLVAGTDEPCRSARRRVRRRVPRRRRSTISGSCPVGQAVRRRAGADRHRAPRQAVGTQLALHRRRRRPLLGAQRGVAAAPHRLLVALDLLGRQVVAAHDVGEELHDALQLLGDDAVGAGRQQRLHLGDVARAHDDAHGRIRDPRHRRPPGAPWRDRRRAPPAPWRGRCRRAAACAARLASPSSTGKPGLGRLGRALRAERRDDEGDARAVEHAHQPARRLRRSRRRRRGSRARGPSQHRRRRLGVRHRRAARDASRRPRRPPR